MSNLTILAAAGVGYVLGARAGRERYEQLRQAYDRVKSDPRVQEKAHQAAEVVKDKAPVVAEAVKEKAGEAASAAADAAGSAKAKVSGSDSSSSGASGGSGGAGAKSEAQADGNLNPDRIKLTDDKKGPQGDLP